MAIEQRYSARQRIELQVHIHYRKRRFYSAKGRNLSEQGMFLEVRNLTLPTGTMIELELTGVGGDSLIAAVVTHQSGSGIGVMFRDPQPEIYRSFCAMQGLALPLPVPKTMPERVVG